MKSVHPFVALAGAAVVFAAGYAWGAAGDSADPFLNTKVLATSGVTFVDGPEAEPPPWPANAQQTVKPATAQPAAMTAASAPPAAPLSALAAAPAGTGGVAPSAPAAPSASTALADEGASLALNDIPSSAIAPVYHPPAAPAETEATPPDGTRRVARHLRTPPEARKQITFGTRRGGQPVTIIWDTR